MLTYGSVQYVYTPARNLSMKIEAQDTTHYTYDAFGNLLNVVLPNSDVIDYIVDGLNRRIAKLLNGSIVKKWLYQDQLNPIAELDSNNVVLTRFVYGTKVNVPDYIIKDDSTYKVVTDHLGSVRLVVNSVTGNVVQQIEYDEYGVVLSQTGSFEQPFGFAGGLTEVETGLVRFGARDYDSEVGRWTAKDPILFGGGVSNLYEYCGNDPVNKIDPSGLQDIYVFGEIDVVGITGGEGGLEIVIDLDNPGESGVFFSGGMAGGANVGAAVGIVYAPNDIEGTSTTFDINALGGSLTVSSDNNGYNGFAVTVGPGGGASTAVTTTSSVTINDFFNWLSNAYKDVMYELYKWSKPCP